MRISGLPFTFDIQGDPRQGGAASLRVDLGEPILEEGFDQLRCVVAWFAQLGELGMWTGNVLPPGQSRSSLPTGEPDGRQPRASWQFDVLSVDPASLVVLANLIFQTRLSVQRVELVTGGSTDPKVVSCEGYPQRPSQSLFAIDENRVDRNVELTIDFMGDVPPPPAEKIADILRVWTMVASLGGWRQAGPLREKVDLIPDDDPELILDQLKFSFRDNGLHDSAYDGLVALVAAIAVRMVPVAHFAME